MKSTSEIETTFGSWSTSLISKTGSDHIRVIQGNLVLHTINYVQTIFSGIALGVVSKRPLLAVIDVNPLGDTSTKNTCDPLKSTNETLGFFAMPPYLVVLWILTVY